MIGVLITADVLLLPALSLDNARKIHTHTNLKPNTFSMSVHLYRMSSHWHLQFWAQGSSESHPFIRLSLPPLSVRSVALRLSILSCSDLSVWSDSPNSAWPPLLWLGFQLSSSLHYSSPEHVCTPTSAIIRVEAVWYSIVYGMSVIAIYFPMDPLFKTDTSDMLGG